MRVTMFKNPNLYSCNMYLIRGDWNKIDDINTLIDSGTDDYILNALGSVSTGVGKRRVEQILITHEHFDHAGGTLAITKIYDPDIYAYKDLGIGNKLLKSGMTLRVGDCEARIIHTPGHSNDSVCIYIESEGVLFSGDTPLIIKSSGGTYSQEFIDTLKYIATLKLNVIYSGHDDPVVNDCNALIRNSIRNISLK